ncbi:MAG: hypothetical protein AAF127_14435 [Pseudomonadota bacterium]
MSILDPILSPIDGAPNTVSDIAKSVGIDPAIAEKIIMTLTDAHVDERNTMAVATVKTGLDAETLSTVIAQLGGEEILGKLAIGLSMGSAGRGNSGLMDDLALFFPGLFGKKA